MDIQLIKRKLFDASTVSGDQTAFFTNETKRKWIGLLENSATWEQQNYKWNQNSLTKHNKNKLNSKLIYENKHRSKYFMNKFTQN